MPHDMLLSLYAILSGVAFGVLGAAYRLGQSHGLRSTHLFAVLTVTGSTFFAAQSIHAAPTPAFIIVLAVVSGLLQYVAVRLVNQALHLGPLSPIWCMVSLFFIPPTLYSCLIHHKTLTPLQLVGLGLAVACAVLASLPDPSTDVASSRRRPILYPIVLLLVFLTNSLMSVAIADLKDRPGPDLWTLHGSRFLMFVNITLGACVWIDLIWTLLRTRSPKPALVNSAGSDSAEPTNALAMPFPWRALIAIGLLAALGSNGGLFLQRLSGSLSGAVTLTLSGMASLLTAGLASVLLFRERAAPRWYLMMACGTAAVPLVNLTGGH